MYNTRSPTGNNNSPQITTFSPLPWIYHKGQREKLENSENKNQYECFHTQRYIAMVPTTNLRCLRLLIVGGQQSSWKTLLPGTYTIRKRTKTSPYNNMQIMMKHVHCTPIALYTHSSGALTSNQASFWFNYTCTVAFYACCDKRELLNWCNLYYQFH